MHNQQETKKAQDDKAQVNRAQDDAAQVDKTQGNQAQDDAPAHQETGRHFVGKLVNGNP